MERTPLLSRKRSRSHPAPRTPLSAEHKEAMQAGRAQQRARSASKRLSVLNGAAKGAAIRRAGRDRAREVANDAAQSLRMRDLIGAPGRGVVVPHERVLLCLTAYHKASRARAELGVDADVDDAERAMFASVMSDLSVETVRKLVRQWEDTGELPVEQPGVRGAAADAYERWARLPDGAHEAVKKHITEVVTLNKNPFAYTRKVLQDFIDDTYDVQLSLRICGRLLFRWGFVYGELEREVLGGSRPARMIAKQIHLVQLDAAMKQGHVIVYLDETYANIRLAVYRGYAPSDNRASASVPKGGLGDRLCYVNAVGVKGLLAGNHSSKEGVWDLPPNGNTADDPLFGGELMFEAKSGSGDYHGTHAPRVQGSGRAHHRPSSPPQATLTARSS
jgi:transposase